MDHLSSSTDRVNVLEYCIRDILSIIKPSEIDRTKRLNAITQFRSCLRSAQISTVAEVQPFGSFVSNLYSKGGDVDVSVQLHTALGISASKTIKRNTLKFIMRALRRSGVARHLQFIPNARVPLLIFKSNHDLSFDVSINNYLGIAKSKILLWISQIDDRFRDMVLLTKEWAKAQDINDPKSGTLNSYSLCLMVIFHLQTCDPPILPSLREIYQGNISDDITGWTTISERQIEDACAANIERFRSLNYRMRNQSSLAQLLISFFRKYYDLEVFASEFAICTYTGDWERIKNDMRWSNKPHRLLIEDPFERPENAARAVGARELCKIANAFRDAYEKLCSSTVLADRNYLLSILTRPAVGSQLTVQPQVHNYSSSTRHAVGSQLTVRPQVHNYSNSSTRHAVGSQLTVRPQVHNYSNSSIRPAVGSQLSVRQQMHYYANTSTRPAVGSQLSVRARVHNYSNTSTRPAVGSQLSVRARVHNYSNSSTRNVVSEAESVVQRMGGLMMVDRHSRST